MIKNKPAYADEYEFIVARKVGDEFWFWGAYADGWKANQIACELDEGVIFHNVRIQGRSH